MIREWVLEQLWRHKFQLIGCLVAIVPLTWGARATIDSFIGEAEARVEKRVLLVIQEVRKSDIAHFDSRFDRIDAKLEKIAREL